MYTAQMYKTVNVKRCNVLVTVLWSKFWGVCRVRAPARHGGCFSQTSAWPCGKTAIRRPTELPPETRLLGLENLSNHTPATCPL